ncbi:MAG TPA: hypothetical protein PKA06_06145 [Gemmatales bacterium]|nr:hypothetical protein [Gemmatales bacterium]
MTPGFSTVTGLAENAQRQFNLTKSIEELSAFQTKLEKVFQSARYHESEGHIVIDELTIIKDPVVVEYLLFGLPQERINLPPSTSLCQFRLVEFDAFYQALRRWSFCSTYLFLSALTKHGREQWYCVPTQVMQINHLINSLVQLADLYLDIVRSLVQFLKYDARTNAPDIFQQPLILGSDSVAWSAHLVQSSQYQRNMLKLLARTKTSERVAANLIGSNYRQKSMLNDIGVLLSQKGKCAFKLKTEIRAGNDKGEIDLLAYSTQYPEDVLLIEGKAVLGVDEINEVDAATKEMIIG